MFYKEYQVYDSLCDCHLKSSDTIQVKALNKPDGWTIYTSDFMVANTRKLAQKCAVKIRCMLRCGCSN